MRIQDIIRSMIDMIDGVQQPEEQPTTVIIAKPEPEDASPLTHAGDDINRWRQIVDLASGEDCRDMGNAPNEKYAGIEAVTGHAGGGVNGPKDPSDLRGEHQSMYPTHQDGWRK